MNDNNKKKWLTLLVTPLAFLYATQALAEQQSSTTRGDGVLERSRGDYLPKGIKLGGFTVKPALESENVYNSNIYLIQNNSKDDFIFHVKPSVNVLSNWSKHSLAFTGSADTLSYATHSKEDQQNYIFNLDGRFDIMKNSFAHANATYSHLTESRGSPDSNANGLIINGVTVQNSAFSALKPVQYQTVGGTFGIEHKINRVKLNVDHAIHHLDFANGQTGNGTQINNKDRNRLINESTLRVGYEITPGYEAFLKGGYNFINYGQTFDDFGYQRSSDGYKVVTGLALDLTGKLTGDAYVGYQSQNFDDYRLATISGVTGGLGLKWNPTGLTTVKARVDRTINQTTQNASSGYFSTLFTLGVTHELLRNLILTADAGYGLNDYKGGNNRSESLYSAGVGAKYLINRNFYLKGGYEYNNRTTNIQNTNYDLNRVFLTIGSQL